MNEELLSAQLPHTISGEQAVIGAMLIDENCIPLVIEQVKSHDFHMKQNRDIFDAVASMFHVSTPTDPVTITQEMTLLGTYDPNGTDAYMLQLMETTPTAANISEYISILKDVSLLRDIAMTGGELSALARDPTNTGKTLLDLAEQRIFGLRQGRSTRGLLPISQILLDMHDRLAILAESKNAIPGLSTGLPDLDRAISGLKESDLILLAARPGMGKTSLALNLLLHTGKHSGKSVAFFSLEMSRDQLAQRLIAAEGFIDSKKLVTGKLNDSDWEKIIFATDKLQATRILIDDDAATTVSDISAKCRRVKDLGLIVIDYLQLMTAANRNPNRGENRQQVVSDISRSLKLLAKDLNVPVICLSQLSRAVESRQSKRPMLSDLRESGAIEQDADIVLFLYREDSEADEDEAHSQVECLIAKNRQGEIGSITLNWLPQYTAFTSVDHYHQE